MSGRARMSSKKFLNALASAGEHIDNREHQEVLDDLVALLSDDPEEAKLALKFLKNGIHKNVFSGGYEECLIPNCVTHDEAKLLATCSKELAKNDKLYRHKVVYWLFRVGPKTPLETHDFDELVDTLKLRLKAVGNHMRNLKITKTEIDWNACGCYYFSLGGDSTENGAGNEGGAAGEGGADAAPTAWTHVVHRLSGTKAILVFGAFPPSLLRLSFVFGLWSSDRCLRVLSPGSSASCFRIGPHR